MASLQTTTTEQCYDSMVKQGVNPPMQSFLMWWMCLFPSGLLIDSVALLVCFVRLLLDSLCLCLSVCLVCSACWFVVLWGCVCFCLFLVVFVGFLSCFGMVFVAFWDEFGVVSAFPVFCFSWFGCGFLFSACRGWVGGAGASPLAPPVSCIFIRGVCCLAGV